jgi:hypothetical protein
MSCQLNDQFLSSIRSTGCATNSLTSRSYLLCRVRTRFTVTRLHPDPTKLHAKKNISLAILLRSYPHRRRTHIGSLAGACRRWRSHPRTQFHGDRSTGGGSNHSLLSKNLGTKHRTKGCTQKLSCSPEGRATAGVAWRQSELAEFSERSGAQLSRAAGRPRANEGNRGEGNVGWTAGRARARGVV